MSALPSLTIFGKLSSDLLSSLISSAKSFLIQADEMALNNFQAELGKVGSNKDAKTVGKILLSLIPNLALSDTPVATRLSNVELPEGWNDAAKNSFVEYLDSAVKECREFRDRGGQLIVYTDDGKAHSTTSTASVPPPSLRYTFGVTSSTDLLSSVGKTFLRCEFNGEVVEMDVKGVYRMMAELERARNTMELLEGGD